MHDEEISLEEVYFFSSPLSMQSVHPGRAPDRILVLFFAFHFFCIYSLGGAMGVRAISLCTLKKATFRNGSLLRASTAITSGAGGEWVGLDLVQPSEQRVQKGLPVPQQVEAQRPPGGGGGLGGHLASLKPLGIHSTLLSLHSPPRDYS